MDDHTARLIRENAEAQYVLLAPVRWATNLTKAAFFVLFCVVTLGTNATWWIVGCGSMGWRDRQDRSESIAKGSYEPEHSGVADYIISFNTRSAPLSKEDIKYRQKESNWYPSWMNEGFDHYIPASGISVHQDGGDTTGRVLS